MQNKGDGRKGKGWIPRPIKAILKIVLSLFFITIIYLSYEFLTFLNRPAERVDNETIIINIPPHTTTRELVAILHRNGIIANRELFLIYIKMRGAERRLKAGEFALKKSMLPEEVFKTIYEGRQYLHRIVIPEGFNLNDIARVLVKGGFGTREEFMRVASSQDILKRYKIEGDTVEGFLFPDTYLLSRSDGMERTIRMMLDNFTERWTPDMQKRAEEIGMSLFEVVTLASLIEKETGIAAERKRISGVFHNRLKRGMKLQCDPTIIYSLPNFDGNIRRKDKLIDSPYNTYVVSGLPKGPICSPGIDSLYAALYPEVHDYLYFVSKNNGSHHFSRTLREHNEAVRRYQISQVR